MNEAVIIVTIILVILLWISVLPYQKHPTYLLPYIQYLVRPFATQIPVYEPESQRKFNDVAIVLHGFGDSCKKRMNDPNFLTRFFKFTKVYCFNYPRPGYSNWLKKFCELYEEAKRHGNKVLFHGFSMGGWFALHAANYLTKQDPENFNIIRVMAIAPMTYLQHYKRSSTALKKNQPPFRSSNPPLSLATWHVYASTDDTAFSLQDIKDTYEHAATIHETIGSHQQVIVNYLQELPQIMQWKF
jgi:hypothetical protein